MSYSSAVSQDISISKQNLIYPDSAFFKKLSQTEAVPVDPTREVLETVILNNGAVCDVVMFNPGDAEAIYKTLEAERNNPKHAGKNFILYRSLEKILRMLESGYPVIGALINDHIAAMGASYPVADKDDMGRGKEYVANNCPANKQLYLGMAMVHPALQDEKLDLMNIIYVHRIASGIKAFPDRHCMLIKTNNVAVQNSCTKKGWEHVDTSTVEDGLLYTYRQDNTKALLSLIENRQDVCERHGLTEAFVQNLELLANQKVLANDNIAALPVKTQQSLTA